MKRAILACLAAFVLCSGCVFDDEFWDDYDSTYDSPMGGGWDDEDWDDEDWDDEDCDC